MIQYRQVLILFTHRTCLLYSQNPLTYVFSHGLGSAQYEAVFYVDTHRIQNIQIQTTDGIKTGVINLTLPSQFNILCEPLHTFNYAYAPKVTVFADKNNTIQLRSGVDKKKVSLGQKYEIKTLKKEIDSIAGDIILFGRSLGASSIITFMATHKPKNIKAVILEAPFDTIERVVDYKAGALGWVPGLKNLARGFLYPKYDAKGINPLNCIHKIDNTIPILFIHSKKDDLIPVKSSRKLYKKLTMAGHKDVYLFEMDSANHNNAPTSADAHNYQCTVHAFYKKYDLPHDQELALQGKSLLKQCQPTLKELKNRK